MPHVPHLGCEGGWAGIDSRSLCRRGLGAVIVMGSHTFLIEGDAGPSCRDEIPGVPVLLALLVCTTRCSVRRSEPDSDEGFRLSGTWKNGVRITLLLRPRVRNPYHLLAQYEAFHVKSARAACPPRLG